MNKKELDMLANDLAKYFNDPYGYVMYAFPWGKGKLVNHKGPRKWQKEFLINLGEQVKKRGFNGSDPVEPIQESTSSGHGIGKSALTSWIIKWILDTRPFSKGTVTANTAPQLQTKTWAELGKWHGMSITKDLFSYRNSKGNMTLFSNDHPVEWRCDAYTCKEENSESFAGQHAANSTPFYIFDEASAVPEKIFEVAQGGLTDGEPMFFLFGNPTRNSGFFYRTFGKLRHRWNSRKIDSREVEGTNKDLLSKWVEDHGEDSDYVRVRVKGEFPRASVNQLIPTDLVQEAQEKVLQPHQYNFAPVILGVDVAWMGGDRSVIFKRQGLASTLLWQGREVDSIDLAGIVAQFILSEKADATFVDAGMGNGVIDQL
ncbi:MAG: terminase, partial [Flavobacteriaceae bacterium]|nr:terminase [Flavobacteriaceae bacterium]